MSDTLVMDQRFVWNRANMKEIDEAKALFLKYRRMGYKILCPDGSIMERFKPLMEEMLIKAEKIGGHVMKILTENGDDRLVWDKENGHEAIEAKKKFSELISKGYKAYSVDSKGNKKNRIHEFDTDAEEVLLIPKTVKG